MKYLFSPDVLWPLESLGNFTYSQTSQTLFAFDFDGTLSPIIASPHLSQIAPTTFSLLQSLSQRAPIAIISGRSRQDLQSRCPLSPSNPLQMSFIGNHGLEGEEGFVRREKLAQSLAICRLWKEQWERGTWNELIKDGIILEDKGYSLSLHYRQYRYSHKNGRDKLLAFTQQLLPAPRPVWGKSVLNLIPTLGPNKGEALIQLMDLWKRPHAFYVGDDDTDEDVFHLGPQLGERFITTVRVGMKKDSKAQFFIKRQSEMNRLLEAILRGF